MLARDIRTCLFGHTKQLTPLVCLHIRAIALFLVVVFFLIACLDWQAGGYFTLPISLNHGIETGLHFFSDIQAMRVCSPPTMPIHAIPDHEKKYANRAVQLIAGRSNFRAATTVARRSGTGDARRRASRVPSLPFSAIHHFRQPAIPDGGRSPNQ